MVVACEGEGGERTLHLVGRERVPRAVLAVVRLDGGRDLLAQEARHFERLRAVVGHHLAAAVQSDVARVANLGRARLRVDAGCLRSLVPLLEHRREVGERVFERLGLKLGRLADGRAARVERDVLVVCDHAHRDRLMLPERRAADVRRRDALRAREAARSERARDAPHLAPHLSNEVDVWQMRALEQRRRGVLEHGDDVRHHRARRRAPRKLVHDHLANDGGRLALDRREVGHALAHFERVRRVNLDLVGALTLTLRFVLALVDERPKLHVRLDGRRVAREFAGGRGLLLLRVARARLRAVELGLGSRLGGLFGHDARATHGGLDLRRDLRALATFAFRLVIYE